MGGLTAVLAHSSCRRGGSMLYALGIRQEANRSRVHLQRARYH